MKSLKESFLENSHLFIIVFTFVVACAGWGGKLSHGDIKVTASVYEPQYAFDSGAYVVDTMASGPVDRVIGQEKSGQTETYRLVTTDIESRTQSL